MEQLSTSLLEYLRRETGIREIEYGQSLTPLLGGYDTNVYEFGLDKAEGALATQLVLRLYPQPQDRPKALAESAVQNTLADAGYPAPRVHLTCQDSKVLGRPFIVMEKMPGRPLIAMAEPAASSIMGEAHARLHAIDVGPLTRTLKANHLCQFRLDDRLKLLQSKRSVVPALGGILDWLVDNRPQARQVSICHGDFHKLNLLANNGRLTGVVDWSTFSLMEPAFDVASTMTSFSIVAKYLIEQGDFETVDLDKLLADYLAAYQSVGYLDWSNLDYYRVLRSAMILIAAGEGFRIFQHPGMIHEIWKLIRELSGLHRVAR